MIIKGIVFVNSIDHYEKRTYFNNQNHTHFCVIHSLCCIAVWVFWISQTVTLFSKWLVPVIFNWCLVCRFIFDVVMALELEKNYTAGAGIYVMSTHLIYNCNLIYGVQVPSSFIEDFGQTFVSPTTPCKETLTCQASICVFVLPPVFSTLFCVMLLQKWSAIIVLLSKIYHLLMYSPNILEGVNNIIIPYIWKVGIVLNHRGLSSWVWSIKFSKIQLNSLFTIFLDNFMYQTLCFECGMDFQILPLLNRP